MRDQQVPFVSLILPIRNEEQHIAFTISAVLSQDYPQDSYCLIIVDGASTDRTKTIIEGYARMNPDRIHVHDNPGKTFSLGFNIGLAQSESDIVIMLGGHVEISNDYVSRCVEVLAAYQCDCAGGVISTVAETLQGNAIAMAMSSKYGVGGVAFRTGTTCTSEVDTVAFGAYRRDVFDRYGLLDESMVKNQDDEYNYRIRKGGAKIVLSPAIRAVYHGRASYRTLTTQYFNYGRWKVAVWKRHPGQMRVRHFIPALFVVGMVVASLASLMCMELSWLFPFLAGMYLVSSSIAAAIAARTSRKWQIPFILAAFMILHLSYGSGFIRGLFAPVPPPSFSRMNVRK